MTFVFGLGFSLGAVLFVCAGSALVLAASAVPSAVFTPSSSSSTKGEPLLSFAFSSISGAGTARARALGSSMTLGLASHRASACAASNLILSCRAASARCSSSEGGSRRACRSHWCHWGLTLTWERCVERG